LALSKILGKSLALLGRTRHFLRSELVSLLLCWSSGKSLSKSREYVANFRSAVEHVLAFAQALMIWIRCRNLLIALADFESVWR
jgi:hypothetical protein